MRREKKREEGERKRVNFNIFLLVNDWVKWKIWSCTYVTPCVASGSASLITAQFLRESSSEGLFSTDN